VLAVLDADGPGQITGPIKGEFHQKMNEILRELPEGDGQDKALEKIADLRSKVADALEKGEITSTERAAALDDALEQLAATIA